MERQALLELRQLIDTVLAADSAELTELSITRLKTALQMVSAGDQAHLEHALAVLESVVFEATPIIPPIDLASQPVFDAVYTALTQLRAFALALAHGDLAQRLPVKGVMAGGLKNLQANLRHLTWQAQRIAENDFSQRVDFMGEFSDAFNAMVARLADTIARLQQREVELTAVNLELQHYREHLEELAIDRTAELDQARQRLQVILDTVGDGIELLGPMQEVQYVNPAMERLTGYTAAEMIGATPYLWRSPSTPESSVAELERSVADGAVWRGELICRRKDGQLYDAQLDLNPLKTSDGRLLGFVAVQRDITQLKELARLKDQFVTRVGHELRTPLSSLSIYLELLEKGKPEKRDRYLETLNRETARLRDLVESFIELARWDTGSMTVQLSPYDMRDLMSEIVTSHAAAARERDLTLTGYSVNDLPRVLVERGAFHQAVVRLLDNALKYTPRGGTITLSATVARHDDRDWVALAIHNDGPGLTPDELPRLFEPFYRGHATDDYATSGVGLGLSIAQTILRKLGGRITVESVPGQGVTFNVWLQRAG